MGLLSSIVSFTMLLLASLFTGGLSKCNGVVLREHSHTTAGKKCTLKVGDYKWPWGKNGCPKNDALSKVELNGNCVVYLYKHGNFKGSRWTLMGENKKFGAGKCFRNDDVSSVRIMDGGCTGALMRQHSHTTSGQNCMLKPGSYSWPWGKNGCPPNDHLSYVDNVGNCATRLYQHGGFNGKSWKLIGNRGFAAGSNFRNDDVSSVKIMDRGCVGVVLQEHSHTTRGKKCTLKPGNYGWLANAKRGCPNNDSLSLVRTIGNCRVQLFEHARFGGKVYKFAGFDRTYAFPGNFKNDDISSIKIFHVRAPSRATCGKPRAGR